MCAKAINRKKKDWDIKYDLVLFNITHWSLSNIRKAKNLKQIITVSNPSLFGDRFTERKLTRIKFIILYIYIIWHQTRYEIWIHDFAALFRLLVSCLTTKSLLIRSRTSIIMIELQPFLQLQLVLQQALFQT